MRAREAYNAELEGIERHCQCPHGITGYGMWMAACAEQAVAEVGDDAPDWEFWDAYDSLCGEHAPEEFSEL